LGVPHVLIHAAGFHKSLSENFLKSSEGHAQMDLAFEKGVNFFDTAELYPVPATAETQGRTSEIVGTWLKKTGNRDKIVIGSKIAGTGDYTAHIRTTGFSGTNRLYRFIPITLARTPYQHVWCKRLYT